ncbi:MAG: M14 family zinc carboxypeptidase [Chitinophagaceae bacterium]
MKTIKPIFLFVVLMLAQITEAQEKFSKIRIRLPEAGAERKAIFAMMDADHFNSEGDGIVAEISEHAQKRLRESGYQFDILIDDVTKHFVEQSKLFFTQAASGNRAAFETSGQSIRNFISTPSLFSTNGLPPGAMGGYYTFSEMNAEMNALVSAFPSLVQKTSLGLSVEGRNIWCLKISDNVSSDENNEPEVLYLGLQHAREAITGTSLIFFAQYLAQNYATNTAVRNLVNNREIFIVPCTNPDGYVYNEINDPSGGGMQRKNRRNVGSDGSGGQKGVDLNRNYGVDWSDCSGASSSCGSSNTSNETYWGSAAFSEPETRAIRDLCFAQNFVAAFDQHCSGPYYSLPFGRRSYHTMSAPDRDFYSFIPALMGKYNGHRAGDSYATVQYEVAGGAKDWWLLGDIESFPGEPNKKGKMYGMTGEAGGGGFWAPSSQIIELCKNLCFQNMQLAYAAGSYVDVQDMDEIRVTTLNPNLQFKVQRVGLGDEPVTVSIIPLENIASVGSPVTISSLPAYYDTYIGNIPITIPAALGNAQRIKFVWRVETGGISIYDTVSKMYNPLTIFWDNMEGASVSTNWNVSGGWNFTSAFANGGSRSLTESPGGDYTESDTRIAAYRNAFNLSDATVAYISFWTRHRAENFRDILRLQISTNSTNGMDGTWTSLPGRNTVQENNTTNQGRLGGLPALTGIRENWTKELIEIPASFYTSSNVWFRFEFSSDATSFNDFENDLDDGFYIDDFRIIKSTTALIVLPVQFISFTGQLLPDETVRLNWEAVTDQQHDYFEVEKSADGSTYNSIGKGPSTGPYRHLDTTPFTGNNFYRIKQVDKDGGITYSHTVTIYYSPVKYKVSVYPNPVKDVINVKLNASMSGQYTITIVDLSGRKIHEERIMNAEGGREVVINFQKQAAQLYIITIRDEKNEIIATQKVVKR